MTNYLTQETEAEHGERYGVDDTQEERQWCEGCASYVVTGTECGHAPKLKAEPEMVTLVCSCGYKTCPCIPFFGLTEVTFGAVIEPIPLQVIRDVTAREIKAGGGL